VIEVISVCLAIVLGSVAVLHVFWAFGCSWGSAAAIPERGGKQVFTPSRTVTLLVAAALLIAAGCAVARGGVLAATGSGPVAQVGCWALTAIFGVRAIGEGKYVGFTKRVRNTTFARNDTWIYSPLCALLAAGFLTLARGRF
jgi:fatty acid desaturase